ncbi:uncharacterized protein LOC142338619 [Convolutriloba macropyga]|uniref:uncharacterized protein LOC142338619 n=1 Tax=Convolutriloba macropyga TaxID=536237 RepID=UPI003F51DC73
MFYIFTIPTFLCVTGLYVKSKVAFSRQVSQQLAERGNQLRKAFGVIAFVYTICMLPYVIATPVMQFFDVKHNLANNIYGERTAAGNRILIFRYEHLPDMIVNKHFIEELYPIQEHISLMRSTTALTVAHSFSRLFSLANSLVLIILVVHFQRPAKNKLNAIVNTFRKKYEMMNEMLRNK